MMRIPAANDKCHCPLKAFAFTLSKIKIQKAMKKITLTFLALIGLSGLATAQVLLPEVLITAVRYKYLNAVGYAADAQPVKLLQSKAATYDIKSSEYYSDEYDNYYVSFYIPKGQVLAAYDKDGRLLRTAEKYQDVKLPAEVRDAVIARFPQWAITRDVYLVNYYTDKGDASRRYKLLLENGDKRIRVELNEKGEFN